MVDKETIRQNVRDAFGPFMTGAEDDLAERLYHPDYVNHEADPERSGGPEGARATAEWLRSCFGELSYEVERIIVEDDMAAAYVTMRGTHEGGLPPGRARDAQVLCGEARPLDSVRGRRTRC